jgi:hypothetical protein
MAGDGIPTSALATGQFPPADASIDESYLNLFGMPNTTGIERWGLSLPSPTSGE